MAYIPNCGCSSDGSKLSHHTFTIVDCSGQTAKNSKKKKKEHKFTYEACNAKERQLWQTSIITCMLSYTTTSKVKRERDKQSSFRLLPLSKKFSKSTENNNTNSRCSSSFFASFKFPSSHHVYENDFDQLKRHQHHQSNITSSSMLRKTIRSKKHNLFW